MSEAPPQNLRGQGMLGLGRASHSPSPFLRGGQALGRKVQAMIVVDKANDAEPGLARAASEKLTQSGAPALPWQPSNHEVRATDDGKMQALQETICQHEKKLEQMQDTILRLQEDGSARKKTAERYQRLLARQEKMVENTLSRTQLLLHEQSQILQTQEIFIRRLETQRGGGVLMGMAYMMVSMYVVETPFVQYAIQLVSRPLMGRNRHARWVPHGVKVLCVIQLVTVFRMLGSSLTRTDRLWLSLSGLLQRLGRMASSFFHLSRCPSSSPAIENSDVSRETDEEMDNANGSARETARKTNNASKENETIMDSGQSQSIQPDLPTV